jgi:N-formylglutamate deformylase
VSFSLREPESGLTPVIVEIPHAGLVLDTGTLSTLCAPAYSVGRDADLYVDELYEDAVALGATTLVAHASRYVCDLNRDERDVDALAAEGGEGSGSPNGFVWRTTTENLPALNRPLSRAEVERRRREFHRPYHGALTDLIRARHERFGRVIMLCAHSMPSVGRANNNDPTEARADIVPGTRGRTTALGRFIDAPDELARARGWSVRHDHPYRGGYTTGHYGRPNQGVHVVQVEIARRLYMDEISLTKKPNDFNDVRAYCRALVARLVELAVD